MLGMSKDKLARRDGVLRTGVVWIGLLGLSMALMGLSCPGTDTDGDGVVDTADLCAGTAAGATVDADGCSTAQIDTDGDGTYDDVDGCISDPLKTAAGACGCGVADTDTDGDGTADCNETLTVSVSGDATADGGDTVSLTATTGGTGGTGTVTTSWAITTPLTTGSATIAPADGVGQVLSVTLSDDAEGTMALTVTATDTLSLSATATHDIVVTPAVATASTTFTVNTDTLTGSANDDTFDGSLWWDAGAFNQTVSSADTADGLGGTDTANIGINVAAAISPALTSIEVFNVTMTAAGTLSFATIPDVTTVNLVDGTAAQIVNNLPSIPTLGLDNTAANNVTLAFAPATVIVGTADAMTASVERVTGGTLTIPGIESLSIASGGAVPNVIATLTMAALTDMTVTGDQDLTITNAVAATTFDDLDASAFTGDLTIIMPDSAANTVAVTGGPGDDTINSTATPLAAGDALTVDLGAGDDVITVAGFTDVTDTIDGGDGTEDTLASTDAVLGAVAANLTTLSNVEQLLLTDGINGNITLSYFGTITEVNLTAASPTVCRLKLTPTLVLTRLA